MLFVIVFMFLFGNFFSNLKPCQNRYFPMFFKLPNKSNIENKNSISIDTFLMFANNAYGSDLKPSIEIPEILGTYNQKKIGRALFQLNNENPLGIQWQNQQKIEWDFKGTLKANGLSLNYEKSILRNAAIGVSSFFMQTSSVFDFQITKEMERDLNLKNLSLKDQVDYQRRIMHKQLSLDSNFNKQIGFGDALIYARINGKNEYSAKMKSISASGLFGIIIASGVTQDSSQPASISFSSNGFNGFKELAKIELELKEDMFLGIQTELNHFFPKIINKRLPIKDEHQLFGAIYGEVEVDPGVTFNICPYFELGDLRDGFGAQIAYNFTFHNNDIFEDKRKDKKINITISDLHLYSRWISEYTSIKIFYDPSNLNLQNSFWPKFHISWDIPFKIMKSLNISKTHKISFGCEFNF